MFRRLSEAGETVSFTFDGRPLQARIGDSVAAALLASGVASFRLTPVSGSPRGPWCMMGVCFDCLVVIDGAGGRQACMTPVREGMAVETQAGRREAINEPGRREAITSPGRREPGA
jgi:predicted molibdopterin-dependent oxidoreductase YjgC